MRLWKKALILTVLTVCAALALSACSSSSEINAVRTLVTGNINDVYLGQFDPTYLSMVDTTEEEAKAQYLEGISYEAEFFCDYWNLTAEEYGITYDDLGETLKSDLVSLYLEIYSHTKYELTAVEKISRRNYNVELTLYPIDIMEQADALYQNDAYEPLNDFLREKAGVMDTMNDEERLAFYNEYGKILTAMVRSLLPKLDYSEPVTLSLGVSEDVDGYLMINDDDWANFDYYVISYP